MKPAASPLAIVASDPELLRNVAQGDLAALGLLYDRYERIVRRYLDRIGTSAADADDLVQSTFLQVTRAARSYDGRDSARSWLLGIATFMARRHRRSVLRRLAHLSIWHSARVSSLPETPEQSVESDEAARRFGEAFERLSSKKREVVALVLLEGLSGEEAAESLGVPLNTVWTRLHHARRELRAALERGGS